MFAYVLQIIFHWKINILIYTSIRIVVNIQILVFGIMLVLENHFTDFFFFSFSNTRKYLKYVFNREFPRVNRELL